MAARSRKSSSSSNSGASGSVILIWVLLIFLVFESFILFKIYRENPRQVTKHLPQFGKLKSELSPKKKSAVKKKAPAPKKTAAKTKPAFPPSAKSGTGGRIAIIIDDSGYNIEDCDHLQAIDTPITVAILPDLAHSKDIDACANRYGKEVMLHLPLEPYHNDEQYPTNYIINTSMPKHLVLERLNQSLANVPHAAGVNNHMGSKATESSRLMAVIFERLKQNDLFFIDSRTSGKSICRPLAWEKKLDFAQRDIFLDNENTRDYIEGQFELLAAKASEQGYAIAIGHARDLTWRIVEEQTERLTQEGYTIVSVQDLIDDLAGNQ